MGYPAPAIIYRQMHVSFKGIKGLLNHSVVRQEGALYLTCADLVRGECAGRCVHLYTWLQIL